MDASDVIRKLQSKAIYSVQKQALTVTQPTCNISTCAAPNYPGCQLTFPNYQYMNLFYQGKQYCSSCTNTCGC